MKESNPLTDRNESLPILQEILFRVTAIEMQLHAVPPSDNEKTTEEVLPSIHWTASKTDLIELIYGLYTNRTLNHGKISIKAITRFFESAFDLKLGNTSLRFQEILRRKDSFAFINQLKNSLDAYIAKIEDKTDS